MKRYIGSLLILAFISTSLAAVPARKAAQTPLSKILVGEGVSFGGIAGLGFTLKDLRLTASKGKQKIERLVIDVGDTNGADMRGWPGYYYAELKKNPQRLVIDFSQMPHANLNEKQLNQHLKESWAVKKTSMTLDPVDNSLNLTLDLKDKTKVRIYQVAGKKTTSKVVIDLIAE